MGCFSQLQAGLSAADVNNRQDGSGPCPVTLWPALSGFGRSELPAVLLLRVLSTLLLPLPFAHAGPCAMVWDQQVNTPVPAVLHTGPYSKSGVPAVWLGHGSATTIVGLCICLPL